jgi:hypothetical protein
MTINAENAVRANYVGGWLAEAKPSSGPAPRGLARQRTYAFALSNGAIRRPSTAPLVWIGWKPGASLRLMPADEWALGHVAVRAIFDRDVRGHMVHTHTCRDDRRVATTAVRTYLTVHRGCHSHALELPTAKSPGDPKPVTRRSNWTAERSERLLCRWGSCAPMSAADFWSWAGTGDPSRREPLYRPEDPDSFNNADDWFDDTSDGPVTAEVIIDGRRIPVDGAWVVVAAELCTRRYRLAHDDRSVD